jgi:imidazolonepropionase-like amidohydrolase
MKLLCFLLFLLLPGRLFAQSSPPPPLALTHVTVIDSTGAPPGLDQTVVVAEGRIAALGRTGAVPIPAAARIVNAKGKFLIPGLWEMHAHATGIPGISALYIANGVTGIRDMGTHMDRIKREREAIAEGNTPGPTIIAAGDIVEGQQTSDSFRVEARDPEEAVDVVRALKQQSVDFIKIGTFLTPEVYRAIVEEAGNQRLTIAGHVPLLVSAREASDSGQRSIEHLMGVAVACSSREAELMARTRAAVEAANAAIRDPAHPDRRRYNAQMKILFLQIPAEAAASYDAGRARALFQRFVRNRTYQCPTLIVYRRMEQYDDRLALNDSRYRYLPPGMKDRLDPKKDPRFAHYTQADYEEVRREFPKLLDLVAQMHRAGVPFLAGSDVMNPLVFPGFSLHEELQLLVKTGFTPMEALQAATRNAAQFLGLDRSFGTVEAGKTADMVLLDDDPLKDIRSTTHIRAVIVRGRYLDRMALDALLMKVQADVTTVGPDAIN